MLFGVAGVGLPRGSGRNRESQRARMLLLPRVWIGRGVVLFRDAFFAGRLAFDVAT